MNVSLIRLKGVERQLKEVVFQLSRLADCWEAELSMQGYNMRPPKSDTSGPEPELKYTEEDMDWATEQLEQMKRYKEEGNE